MKKLFTCLLLLCSLMIVSSQSMGGKQSQDDNKNKVTDEELKDRQMWVGSFGAGQYMVGLGSIVSVSKHIYVLDSAYIVNEVNIDTTGAGFARFYYIEPISEGSNFKSVNTASDRFNELAEKAISRLGGNAANLTKDNMVYKQYPTTSHSRTIEFRFASPQYLDSLYDSVTKAWWSGRGRRFSCP